MTVEIHSEDGFVAIFGSANTIDFFTHTAEVRGLVNAIDFFKRGVTAHPDLVAFELGKIEWPLTDGLNEVAERVIKVLSGLEMAYLYSGEKLV